MVNSEKHYLIVFALILLGALSAVLATNLVVDPFGLFKLVRIQGLNAEKTQQMMLGGRNVKAYAILDGSFDVVILGSSRAQTGIDPRYPVFESSFVYNAALPETNLFELEKVFQLVRSGGQVKTIILGLDFLLFSDAKRSAGDFEKSPFAGRSVFWSRYNTLLSLDSFRYALLTVTDNIKGRKSHFSDLGFKSRAANLAKTGGHRAMFVDVLRNKFLGDNGVYRTFQYSPYRLELLQSIIEQSRSSGIMVYAFISPVHALQLEALRVSDLDREFDQWKRDLARLFSDNNRAHPDQPLFLLFDFSGYNAWTTETVPRADQPLQEMQWYWESSHYKKKLGDLALGRMLAPMASSHINEDFGLAIDIHNIEDHLALTRRARTRYQLENSDEIGRIAAIAGKIQQESR